METTFAGFHQDAAGDWVADLACGHTQHVRHRPPWELRPWVTSPEGRAAKLGQPLDCALCEAVALPLDAREYKRTDTFTEETLPAGLRASHRTKPGTWARCGSSQRWAWGASGRWESRSSWSAGPASIVPGSQEPSARRFIY